MDKPWLRHFARPVVLNSRRYFIRPFIHTSLLGGADDVPIAVRSRLALILSLPSRAEHDAILGKHTVSLLELSKDIDRLPLGGLAVCVIVQLALL